MTLVTQYGFASYKSLPEAEWQAKLLEVAQIKDGQTHEFLPARTFQDSTGRRLRRYDIRVYAAATHA